MMDLVSDLMKRATARQRQAAAVAADVAATEADRRAQYVALVRALATGGAAPLTPTKADELLLALGRTPEELVNDVDGLRYELDRARNFDEPGIEADLCRAAKEFEDVSQNAEAELRAFKEQQRERWSRSRNACDELGRRSLNAGESRRGLLKLVSEDVSGPYLAEMGAIAAAVNKGGDVEGAVRAARAAWARVVERLGERNDGLFATASAKGKAFA